MLQAERERASDTQMVQCHLWCNTHIIT